MLDRALEPALFDRERVHLYPVIVLAVFFAGLVALIATSRNMIDFRGAPIGADFITFWGTSSLTLDGRPEAAFDATAAAEAQRLAVPETTGEYYWHYPPLYQFLTAPLALLPYGVSLSIFVLAGYACYLLALRPLLRHSNRTMLLAAFPPALVCIFHGQNSLFSAALLGCAVWLSERSVRGQILAGICIGLLSFKPQFGILIPFALLISGQWRIFVSAAVTVAALVGMTTLTLGPDLWLIFFRNLRFVGALVENAWLPWEKMVSGWIFFRSLGAPDLMSDVLHSVIALAAAGTAMLVWWRCGMTRLSWAVLITATLMIPQYIFDYDLTLLAVPIAILASDMAASGASRMEKTGLLTVALLAGVTAPLMSVIAIPVGLPLLAGLLWLTARRAIATGKGGIANQTRLPDTQPASSAV